MLIPVLGEFVFTSFWGWRRHTVLADDLDGRADRAEREERVLDSELSDRGKALGILQPDDSESVVARRLRGHVLPDAYHRVLNVTVEDRGTVKLTAAEERMQEDDLRPAGIGEQKVSRPHPFARRPTPSLPGG